MSFGLGGLKLYYKKPYLLTLFLAKVLIYEEDIFNLDALRQELLWLTPEDCSVYSAEDLDLTALDYPGGGRPGGGGGGGRDFELLITFLKDDAVIIALITAITTVLAKVIEISRDSEITIEIGDRKLTLKGAVKNKDEMITKLFPELSNKDIEPSPSKLASWNPHAKLRVRTKTEIEFTDEDDTSLG